MVLPGTHAQSVSQPLTLRLGVYHNPPKIFLGSDGRPSGLIGDLLNKVAEAEGWQIKPVRCQWQSCLTLLKNGNIDLMPDVAMTPERRAEFFFPVEPILLSWSQIYVSANSKLSSLLDLKNKRIAVLEESVQQQYLTRLNHAFQLHYQFIRVSDFELALQAVQRGEADAAATSQFYGRYQAADYDLVAAPIMFQPTELYVAANLQPSASIKQALQRLDSYLTRWKAEQHSPYYSVLKKWSGSGEDGYSIPQFVWWIGLLLLGALLLTFFFIFTLRRLVKDKTYRLEQSENRLNTILNSVDAFIFIKDLDLKYQYINQKFCELTGLSERDIIGKTDHQFFDAETAKRLAINDRRVLEKGERIVDEEVNTLTKSSAPHTFLSVKLPLRDGSGQIYALCGISTDITEYRNIQSQLQHLAFFDVLSGLPNRRFIIDKLQNLMAQKQSPLVQGALAIIDIDEFKSLNDTLGHELGDELLKQVANRLEHLQSSKDTVGRLGADEFVAILSQLDQDPKAAAMHAQQRTRQIAKRLSQPYFVGSHEVFVTVSIGLAMFSDVGNDVEELLKGADIAMHTAKRLGRNNIQLFNTDMQAIVDERLNIESRLREAVAKDQFYLVVQPQFNQLKQMVAMEALLRWHHPELGEISPGQFIPIAEQSGLMLAIGKRVIEQSCEILRRWQSSEHWRHIKLAINISPAQFNHEDFVPHLENTLQRFQVNPERLELEITETLLIQDFDAIIDKLNVLREWGISVSLDDFGTGYASLSYLKRLPLAKLKIDQSFVRDMLNNSNDEVIVRSIIGLGNNLGLTVVAEGVETSEQLQRLQQIQCFYFQGFYLGKPQRPEQWELELSSNSENLATGSSLPGS
ncbi:diguanylate cyclase [Idiomarina tyrosinivorans]|uniref:Diguanylate cyclase n=2 Tax=Idiomarina tyrosinivorans TaxID=1445662 RepID=A0A432ZQM1_9GAMM|nr:diguanylate cyclase [Idiomarina tyrosinivorans]